MAQDATIWNPKTGQKTTLSKLGLSVGSPLPTGYSLWTGGTATGAQAQAAINKPKPTIPTGAVAIPGAQYQTKEAQQGAFTNIQPIGGTLYGIPKVPGKISADMLGGETNNTLNELLAKNQQTTAQSQFDAYKSQLEANTAQTNQAVADFLKSYQATTMPSADEIKQREAVLGKQKQISDLESSYKQGQNLISDKVIPLEYQVGQKAALQRQYAEQAQTLSAEEANLINRLNLTTQDRQNIQKGLLDTFQIQQKIQEGLQKNATDLYTAAQKLTSDQQQTAASIISSLSGVDPSKANQAQLGNLFTQAGIPFDLGIKMLQQAYDVQTSKTKQQEFENTTKLMQLQQAGTKGAPTSFEEWTLAGGQAGTGMSYGEFLSQQKPMSIAEQLKLMEGGYQVVNGEIKKNYATTPEQRQTAEDTISYVDKLLNSPAFNRSVGPADAMVPPISGEGASFRQNFETLQALLALGNLSKLKGPMSDKDVAFIKDASSGLNLSMGEDQFRKRLQEIKQRANVINLQPGELQENTDGTYSYRNLDGSVHTGKLGDKYQDKTLPNVENNDPLGLFKKVGADTKAGTTLVRQSIGKKEAIVAPTIAARLSLANREFKNATGKEIDINQSFRTFSQQAQLYKDLSAKGAQVAPAGKSFHEKGLAIDVTNWKEAEPYLRKYGLLNNLANDKGHFSFGEFA